MSHDRLAEARHEARDEAAPFVGLAFLTMVGLAVVSVSKGWEIFDRRDWWIWLVLTIPLGLLVLLLALEVGRGHGQRVSRDVVSVLIGAVVVGSLIGLVAIVVSLTTSAPPGGQLLVTAAALVLVNVIAFGLALWELDCGGPVARSVTVRKAPDLQFPQDENPELARPDWAPHLLDYVYVSLTNSIAFSPTDAMPLTRPAKALMALEGAASAVTVLVVAARAINIIA